MANRLSGPLAWHQFIIELASGEHPVIGSALRLSAASTK